MNAMPVNNVSVLGKVVSLVILVFGVLVIIGSIKDWDWLYKPDQAYHNKWTMGQISRYFGRGTARVMGFIGGIILVIAGGAWSYMAFLKK